MLGCTIIGYSPSCTSSVGGVGNLYVGDANDFDFTQGAADAAGNPTGYTAIALRTGATSAGGAYLYEINALADTLQVDISQSNPEFTGSEYNYEIKAKVAKLGQTMAQFTRKLDAASVCCQLVFIWIGYDGGVLVAGEKYVNAKRNRPFRFKQDGSKFTTGAKFSSFNGGELVFKSSYLRMPYEYTGQAADLEALIAPE